MSGHAPFMQSCYNWLVKHAAFKWCDSHACSTSSSSPRTCMDVQCYLDYRKVCHRRGMPLTTTLLASASSYLGRVLPSTPQASHHCSNLLCVFWCMHWCLGSFCSLCLINNDNNNSYHRHLLWSYCFRYASKKFIFINSFNCPTSFSYSFCRWVNWDAQLSKLTKET